MKIAYVSADPGVPAFGRKGCSVHVQEMNRALLRAGHSVALLASSFKGFAPDGLERAGTIVLPRASGALPAAEREQEALANNTALAESLNSAGLFDLIYERYSLWSYAGMEWARSRSIPGILEVNAPLIDEQAAYRTLIDRPAAVATLDRACGAASAIVAVSDGVAGWLEGFGVESDRIHVIPNGVDPARFHPAITPTLPGGNEFTVGFTGTLKPWHGLRTLADAFLQAQERDPLMRLLIVGDGPQRDELEASLAQAPCPDRVIFTGAVDPGEVPGLVASMDVAVAPYEDLDDFYFSPLKLFEYMAAGRAVAASSIGQIPEIISHRSNGLLVPAGDAGELAGALLEMREHPALRQSLGAAARDSVAERHTWDAVAGQLLEIAASPVEATA
ncbi:glycosyltransferase family 4 protein [soil metagenome]